MQEARRTDIEISEIRVSKTNPRKTFDKDALQELTDSVKRFGVLQPILVRPLKSGYELVAGERRFRASKAAKLETIPVVVRELTDVEVLEVQVIENLHRADLHPMEEAEGYELLHDRHDYTVEDLAAKVGKSKTYVYGRLKLCALTKEAREAFLEDRFSPAHAVILARLPSKVQLDALNPDKMALFEYERTLWDARGGSRASEHIKVRSVREFKGWVDKNVRFHVDQADLMFEPDAVKVAEEAEEEGAKLLAITWEHQVPPNAREGRTLTCRSWKKADGDDACEHSQPAIVVVGSGRGDAFRVCTAKKKCRKHWSSEMREAKRRASQKSDSPSGTPKKPQWQIDQERQQRRKARWDKARPSIAKVVAEKVAKMPAKPGGLLAQIILRAVTPHGGAGAAKTLVPRGDTHEELIRHAAFIVLNGELGAWGAYDSFRKRAKALKIELRPLIDAANPKPKPPPKKKAAKKKATKKRGVKKRPTRKKVTRKKAGAKS